VVELLGGGDDLVVDEVADHLRDLALLVGLLLIRRCGYGHGSSTRSFFGAPWFPAGAGAKDTPGIVTLALGEEFVVSKQQSTAELIELIRWGGMSAGGATLEGSEGIDQMTEILRHNSHPEFVTIMSSESGMPLEYRGVEGFREALSDWISPYERFRLEIDEAIPLADKIVFVARQVATTKHDGVEIETPSASVWWLEDGLIRQASFYLDQRAGLEAAGLDPDRHGG